MQFAPSVYEHAARVIARSPWEVSRDVALLARGHTEAYRLYEHRPIVVGIDIYNLEAEAYGAVVSRASGNGIPAIHEHPFSTARALLDLEPFDPKSAGRIPMVMEAAGRVAAACPGADVRVPLSGPFSLATNLVGFENILCEVRTAPELVARALMSLVGGQVEFCREIARHSLGIAFFESAAAPPLLSPANFRDLELPALKAIMGQTARLVSHPVPCIMGGDTLPILDALLATGTGYLCCPAETDQRGFMAKMKSRPEVKVRINMAPGPITANDFDVIKKEVDRVIALMGGRTDVCLGTGCLPFEADPQMVQQTKEYVLSRNATRQHEYRAGS
ncbi:MAG: uroporphyrinogen decarboxylase family protein [Planctomycetes bacterium]|jgi:uroporphyrinogen decarboxylase|nr:uroporphyrinogen decarboxylase family protein [Planctomycetota bacterium]